MSQDGFFGNVLILPGAGPIELDMTVGAPASPPASSPRTSPQVSPLSVEWRCWVAENVLLGKSKDSIIEAMVGRGIDRAIAAREIATARAHPYIMAAAQQLYGEAAPAFLAVDGGAPPARHGGAPDAPPPDAGPQPALALEMASVAAPSEGKELPNVAYETHLAEPVLDNPVKLVVWDLDDTFWKGTLSEESVAPVTENIELVKRLAARGIISSICSKNDRGPAANELRKLGVWDYFVLPSISFQPKGSSIAALVEALQLRPANVVFIDDNPSVLAEAAFNCPGLMCLQRPCQLAAQLGSENLRGSTDPELTRLAQYKLLANRYDQVQTSGLSNEDFLRQSDIGIEIDYSVEPHIDRVIELVNRSNQLNYTKVRIESAQEKAAFLADLRAFGFNAGIVRLSDKYADYGIVGFFMTLATLREYKLVHFVFSCRVMNMGVEQYVYDYLNRPSVNISGPVANPIMNYPSVDWIRTGSRAEVVNRLKEFKLALIGGCDLLQLSTYCSMESVEFTNRDVRGLIKRLDDPFFILDDPKRVRQSEIRPLIPAFNADEMIELQDAVRGADAVVLSFYRMMEFSYFRGLDGLTVRFDEDAVKAILASDQALWFVRNFNFVEFSHDERQDLVRRSLERLAGMAKPGARVIVLLENLRKLENNPNELYLRGLYNELIKQQCERIDNLTYLDVNAVTRIDWLWDDGFHMHRQGYYELAQSVRELLS
jgi:FkbH-like protein